MTRIGDWFRREWAYRIRGWATFVDGNGTVRHTRDASENDGLRIPLAHYIRITK